MASVDSHERVEELSAPTLDIHRAIIFLTAKLETADLKAILERARLHGIGVSSAPASKIFHADHWGLPEHRTHI